MGSLAWIFDDSIQPRWAAQLEQRTNERIYNVAEQAVQLEQRMNERINNLTEEIMATLQEALDGWKAYVADLKAQLVTAVAGLTDAQAAAQAAVTALDEFIADDAATDLTQIAAQAQTDADAVQAALDEVKTPVEPPPVIEEPVEEPPVE